MFPAAAPAPFCHQAVVTIIEVGIQKGTPKALLAEGQVVEARVGTAFWLWNEPFPMEKASLNGEMMMGARFPVPREVAAAELALPPSPPANPPDPKPVILSLFLGNCDRPLC